MIGPAELLVGLIILLGCGLVALCNPPRKVSTLQHTEPQTVTPDSNAAGLAIGAAVAVLILAVLFGLAFAAAGAP